MSIEFKVHNEGFCLNYFYKNVFIDQTLVKKEKKKDSEDNWTSGWILSFVKSFYFTKVW